MLCSLAYTSSRVNLSDRSCDQVLNNAVVRQYNLPIG